MHKLRDDFPPFLLKHINFPPFLLKHINLAVCRKSTWQFVARRPRFARECK